MHNPFQLLRDLVVVEGTRRRQQLSDDHLQMLLRARAMARYQVIPHFSEAKAELFTALYEDEHRKLKRAFRRPCVPCVCVCVCVCVCARARAWAKGVV